MKGIKKSAATSRQERSEWYRIVTNPSFKNLYLQNSDDKHVIYLGDQSFGLVSCKTFGVVSNYNYPIEKFSGMWIVGSENGLLCLFDKEPVNPIYLVNPSIQKYRAISSSAVRSIRVHSTVMLGFGYHEQSGDYKIVRFIETKFDDDGSDSRGGNDEDGVQYVENNVEVYSLSTNSWKEIDVDRFPWSSFKDADPSSFVLNERLHWIARNGLVRDNVVLTFDLGSELLEEMKLPVYRRPNVFAATGESIGVLKGCLSVCMYCLPVKKFSERFSIYMMTEYGVAESWTKMYDLVCPEAVRRCIRFIGYDLQVIMENVQCDMFLYDIRKGERNQLDILENRFLLQVAVYKESLVLLDQKKGLVDDHNKESSDQICLLHEKCDCSNKRDGHD